MTTSVLASALTFRRSVFASLPGSTRLVYAYFRLVAMDAATFGRTVYTLFALAGVEDMPTDPNTGEPYGPNSFGPGANLQKAIRMTPSRLGQDYGKKLRGLLAKSIKYGDKDETIDDVLVDTLGKLLRNPKQIREGSTLKEAENFISTVAMNTLRDSFRAKQQQSKLKTEGLVDDDNKVKDIRDVDQVSKFLEGLDRIDANRAIKEIIALGRDDSTKQLLTMYVMEGATKSEIARELGVTPQAIDSKFKSLAPKIQEILEYYFDEYAAVA